MTEDQRFGPRQLGNFVDGLLREGDTDKLSELLDAVGEIAAEHAEGMEEEIVEDETAPHS